MSVTHSRPARTNGKTPALLVFVWGICLTEPILKELRYRVQQIAKSKPFMGRIARIMDWSSAWTTVLRWNRT